MQSDEAKILRKNGIADRQNALPGIILGKASLLDVDRKKIEPVALLTALAWVESSFGRTGGRCRVESSYLPASRRPGTKDGPFFRRHVVDLFALYGDMACASWSSWQIMYPTAWELGFRDPPWKLRDDREAIAWVIEYLNRRALRRGARTVAQIADAYNSGDHRDRFQPKGYMKDVEFYYLENATKYIQDLKCFSSRGKYSFCRPTVTGGAGKEN